MLKRILSAFLILILSLALVGCKEEEEPVNHLPDEKLAYTTQYDKNGGLMTLWNYKYDLEGNVTSSTCQKQEGHTQRNVYTYDENGNEASLTVYLNGGKHSYFEYAYDENGNKTTTTLYTKDGSKTTTTFSYENGLLISEFEESGINTTYVYEDGILKAKNYSFSAHQEFSKEEYFYEGDKNTKTNYYGKAGELLYIDTITYNEDGNKETIKRRTTDGSLVFTWTAYYEPHLTLIGQEKDYASYSIRRR